MVIFIDIIALLNYLSTRILQLQIVFPYSPFVGTPLFEEPQLRCPRGGFTPPFVLRISSFLIPQVISRVTLDDSDVCHDVTALAKLSRNFATCLWGYSIFQYHNLSLEDVLQQILSRNVYISETQPLLMSKNTIDSITEQEENVVTSTSSSSDVGDDPLQGVTSPQSESLGINEMSSPTSSKEEVLDELSSTSLPSDGVDDVTSSTEDKSQLRNFLSVAKAKWDNVPQGWMQQRTNKED